MGANEYTPGLISLRQTYALSHPMVSVTEACAEFDRAIEKIRAEAKAEALEEMAKMIGSKAKILDPEDPIQKGARIGLVTASVDLSTHANQCKEANK